MKTLLTCFLSFTMVIFMSSHLSGQYQKFADSFSILSTIAGKGGMDIDGTVGWKAEYENGDATQAELTRPHFAMADSAGNVYIADKDAHGIRVVDPKGLIRTVAGTNVAGDNGDGPGTSCQLSSPNGLWVSEAGVVYILDLGNDKVRRLDAEGMLETVFHDPGGIALGRGIWLTPGEDSIFYASASRVKLWTEKNGVESYADGFSGLGNICMDREGYLVATDRTRNLVYRISRDGSEKTIIAGNGSSSGGGDGYAATESGLDGVRGVWFLEDNSYFVATHQGSQIWYIDVLGKIHLFLDGRNGDEYHSGDGEDYRTPGYKISEARSVSVDYDGNVLICENDYGFIRKIKKEYTFFYTSIINRTAERNDVHIYPNPASTEVMIQLELNEASFLRVSLLNCLGQELDVMFKEAGREGKISIPVDVSHLPAGLYFFRICTGREAYCRKILIRRYS